MQECRKFLLKTCKKISLLHSGLVLQKKTAVPAAAAIGGVGGEGGELTRGR